MSRDVSQFVGRMEGYILVQRPWLTPARNIPININTIIIEQFGARLELRLKFCLS